MRLLSDESPDVRRAAFEALLRTTGKRAMLTRMLRGVVENQPGTRTRVGVAAAWLTQKK